MMPPPPTEWEHFHVPVTEARTMGLDICFGSGLDLSDWSVSVTHKHNTKSESECENANVK
jgi:hypothetical protein